MCHKLKKNTQKPQTLKQTLMANFDRNLNFQGITAIKMCATGQNLANILPEKVEDRGNS